MGYGDHYWGLYRDYIGIHSPIPLLSTREQRLDLERATSSAPGISGGFRVQGGPNMFKQDCPKHDSRPYSRRLFCKT